MIRATAVAVALSTAAAGCAGTMPAGATEFVCLGTEPFWRLDLTEHEARYTPMEGAAATYAGTLAPVSGRLHSFTWRGGARGDVVAFVARTDACSDGMSDRVYPFEAFVSLPDGTGLQGCCRTGADEAAATPGAPAPPRPPAAGMRRSRGRRRMFPLVRAPRWAQF